MGGIYSFEDIVPAIDPSAYVHPDATVIGNVTIGNHVYIGPGAVLRGDWGAIVIHDGCNVQENCVVHMFPGVQVTFHEGAHVGHGAVIHGATLGPQCLIGMNAVIMDRVDVGEGALIGALAFVAADTVIPARAIAAGNPAVVVGSVSDERFAWKKEGTALYQQLPTHCHASMKMVSPLTHRDGDIPKPPLSTTYKTWKEVKRSSSKGKES